MYYYDDEDSNTVYLEDSEHVGMVGWTGRLNSGVSKTESLLKFGFLFRIFRWIQERITAQTGSFKGDSLTISNDLFSSSKWLNRGYT